MAATNGQITIDLDDATQLDQLREALALGGTDITVAQLQAALGAVTPTKAEPNTAATPTAGTTTGDGYPRWVRSDGISDLSIAVDEIYFLRAFIADEAGILEAHLGYATFPKSRRQYGEASVERMQRVARGEMWAATREKFDQKRALRLVDADDCLTNDQWANQRGLRLLERKSAS